MGFAIGSAEAKAKAKLTRPTKRRISTCDLILRQPKDQINFFYEFFLDVGCDYKITNN